MMDFCFFWKEVLITQSALKYGLVKKSFEENKIPYKVKIVNNGNNARTNGILVGQIGERPELEIIYYLYVKKQNLDLAKLIVRNIKAE
ncbi:hypothetical protein [Massiliimalia massiliensis]|uniref:hypothetical protein n=1 Tax=Massiliimalia massiliensis TaxID=1852384 RepID=UPI0011799CEB|nr:hypothetical protein [Massiliimalia massiliensis]